MKNILQFIKNETVLSISIFLALVSMLFVVPDRQYLTYIDFRTLVLLFCLMGVTGGLRGLGFFDLLVSRLLRRFQTVREVVLVLVSLCFFSSMVITNDVALLTFVPFSILAVRAIGQEAEKQYLLPLVALETLAANLGSMLTPIGNPQNLYLYNKAGISAGNFIGLMLPYALVSLFLILILCQGLTHGFWIGRKGEKRPGGGLALTGHHKTLLKSTKDVLVFYFILFLLCLLTVGRLLPFPVLFVLVLTGLRWKDVQALKMIDYSLLLTFTALFVFIGNLGRISAVRDFFEHMIIGKTVFTAVLASQAFSNVPAAILLSGFTEDLPGLIIGTNLGGLGTLIASMASLISFKFIAREDKGLRGKYFVIFTVLNVFMLAVLLVCAHIFRYISYT